MTPTSQPHPSSARVIVSSFHHPPFEIYFLGENNICGMKKETFNTKNFQGWTPGSTSLPTKFMMLRVRVSHGGIWGRTEALGIHWGMSCTLAAMLNSKLCRKSMAPTSYTTLSLFPEWKNILWRVLNMEIFLVSSFFSTFMCCYLFPQVSFSCYLTFLDDLIHTNSFNYNM